MDLDLVAQPDQGPTFVNAASVFLCAEFRSYVNVLQIKIKYVRWQIVYFVLFDERQRQQSVQTPFLLSAGLEHRPAPLALAELPGLFQFKT